MTQGRSIPEEVISFVAECAGVKANDIDNATTPFGDLGIDGDDGSELIMKFGAQFKVDLSNYINDRYFGPEAAATPWTFVKWFVDLFREGTPESKAKLKTISLTDLIVSAQRGTWTGQ